MDADKQYTDRRNSSQDNAIQYYLEKHRDAFLAEENERRRRLKEQQE